MLYDVCVCVCCVLCDLTSVLTLVSRYDPCLKALSSRLHCSQISLSLFAINKFFVGRDVCIQH